MEKKTKENLFMEEKLKNQSKGGLKLNRFMVMAAGAGAGDLPQEVVEDVLVRLPVKSLARFRCVSKPWLSLITSPQFIQWHLKYHRDGNSSNKLQSSVILSNYTWHFPDKQREDDPTPEFHCIGGGYREDDFEKLVALSCPQINDEGLEIVGCCDGIICMINGYSSMVVWNPSIRELRTLPSTPNIQPHPGMEVHGFGYDSLTDNYKIVRLPSGVCYTRFAFASSPSCNLQIHVLTLKTNSWKRIQDIPHFIYDSRGAISANGGLYWLVTKVETGILMLLRFDLAEETFREVALPPPNDFADNLTSSGLWGGSLCLLCEYELWVLWEDQGWTKLMTFPKIPFPLEGPILSSLLTPLCFINTGKVLIRVGNRTSVEKFVMYDPKERTYEKLDIHGIMDRWFQVTVYSESLISPGTGDAVELQC